jgi:exodeoxyribonuclease-1
MALVFYDTETTGMNATFDQILHFAGVLTDDEFNELNRFEIRGRLLPNLVPLRVTYSESAAVSALAIF